MKAIPTLISLIAFVAAQALGAAAAQTAPDAIYHHGKVVTVDRSSDVAQAFAVKGDRFVAVGTNASVLALADRHTRLIDLRGATVIPGLTDSHDHLWNSAKFEFRGVNVIGVRTLPELKARLRPAVAKARPGEIVSTTTGWRIQPRPTKADLDELSAETPIVLVATRRGGGVMNSAALRRLGISKANPYFNGVKVPVDAQGEPTGVPPEYPAGLQIIDALVGLPTSEVADRIVEEAMAERNALGITSIRELSLWPEGVAALERMRREHRLTLRMAIGVSFPDEAQTAQHLAALPPINRDDPWLFLDCTGEEPWVPGTTTLDKYTALMRAVRRLGWRPCPHVGADLAFGATYDVTADQTLAAYEAVDREDPIKGQRWYLEHVSFATPRQIDQMARLGIILSVQYQAYQPPNPGTLPQARMERINPLRDLIDHGVVVLGGSDTLGPTAPAQDIKASLLERHPDDPMIPFYSYVTRKTRAGVVLGPEEKITRDEALRIFTVNPAYAEFQEKSKGSIAPGMLADFVVLNQDLMTVPEEKILDTLPLATFVGGREVYAAPGARY